MNGMGRSCPTDEVDRALEMDRNDPFLTMSPVTPPWCYLEREHGQSSSSSGARGSTSTPSTDGLAEISPTAPWRDSPAVGAAPQPAGPPLGPEAAQNAELAPPLIAGAASQHPEQADPNATPIGIVVPASAELDRAWRAHILV